jgi:hypothetical protein
VAGPNGLKDQRHASHAPNARIQGHFSMEADQERRTLNEVRTWLGVAAPVDRPSPAVDHVTAGGPVLGVSYPRSPLQRYADPTKIGRRRRNLRYS